MGLWAVFPGIPNVIARIRPFVKRAAAARPALTNHLSALRTRASALTTQLFALRNDLSRPRNDLLELRNHLSALRNHLLALRNHVLALRNDLSGLINALSALRNALSALMIRFPPARNLFSAPTNPRLSRQMVFQTHCPCVERAVECLF